MLLGFVLVPLLVIAVPVARAFRPLEPAFVREWADAHALRLTPDNRTMVEYYLGTAQKLRTLGAVAGIVLPPLVAWALGWDNTTGWSPLLWILPGYLIGAFYAELALNRPLGRTGAASLTPRRVRDYLPARLVTGQRLFGLIAVLGAAAVLVLPIDDRLAGTGTAAAGFIGGAVAVAIEVIERHIVARPQPVVAPDLVAADDAIRSQSMHSVSGSGLAIIMLCVGSVALALAQSLEGPLSIAVVPIVVLFLWAAPLVAWLYYGHRAWRVRRPTLVGERV